VEGSTQIIKEGMACNCPIVAIDVGDDVKNNWRYKGLLFDIF